MKCPDRPNSNVFRLPDEDVWRPNNTCSYCGSLNPDEFMAGLEDGSMQLGVTNKDYKVYVHRVNPNAGQQRVTGVSRSPFSGSTPVTEEHRAQFPHLCEGDHITLGPEPAETQEKFYFSHLAIGQMQRFVDLYNEQKLKFHGGFGFSPFPFFMVRKEA